MEVSFLLLQPLIYSASIFSFGCAFVKSFGLLQGEKDEKQGSSVSMI